MGNQFVALGSTDSAGGSLESLTLDQVLDCSFMSRNAANVVPRFNEEKCKTITHGWKKRGALKKKDSFFFFFFNLYLKKYILCLL